MLGNIVYNIEIVCNFTTRMGIWISIEIKIKQT